MFQDPELAVLHTHTRHKWGYANSV